METRYKSGHRGRFALERNVLVGAGTAHCAPSCPDTRDGASKGALASARGLGPEAAAAEAGSGLAGDVPVR